MEIEGRGELKFFFLDVIWKSKYELYNGGEILN